MASRAKLNFQPPPSKFQACFSGKRLKLTRTGWWMDYHRGLDGFSST